MIDENAFGLLLAYHDVEEDEYALEREGFVERFEGFTRILLEHLGASPPGERPLAVDFGHAVYVEIAEGDETTSLVRWMRDARRILADAGYATVGVVTHGSRWVDSDVDAEARLDRVGAVAVAKVSRPSEPLRRALYADAAARPDDDDASVGWGPGLYLDTEAVEALGIRPKNEPTVLRASGVSFYRAGS